MASTCEFVILSLRGDRQISLVLKIWLADWMGRTAERGACLVALFDPALAKFSMTGAARDYLKQQAAAAGVNFFSHSPIGMEESAPAQPPSRWNAAPAQVGTSRLRVRARCGLPVEGGIAGVGRPLRRAS